MGLSDLERQKRRLLEIEARAADPRPIRSKQIGWGSDAERLDYHHLLYCLDPEMMEDEAAKNKKGQDDWLKGEQNNNDE